MISTKKLAKTTSWSMKNTFNVKEWHRSIQQTTRFPDYFNIKSSGELAVLLWRQFDVPISWKEKLFYLQRDYAIFIFLQCIDFRPTKYEGCETDPSFKLATRAFSYLTRDFELTTRGFELVTRVLLFHVTHNHWVSVDWIEIQNFKGVQNNCSNYHLKQPGSTAFFVLLLFYLIYFYWSTRSVKVSMPD